MGPRRLAALPAPPDGFDPPDLPLKSFAGVLYRIHCLEHDPLFWGRTGHNRFDAPDGEYGVLYAAEHFDGAFIESFGDVDPHVLSRNDLGARGVSLLQTTRALRLVDLAGTGLARLGLDGRISTGDHSLAQRWSKALSSHRLQVDGLWFAARHDADQRAAAIFDRASAAVEATPRGSLLHSTNVALTAGALDAYRFALLP